MIKEKIKNIIIKNKKICFTAMLALTIGGVVVYANTSLSGNISNDDNTERACTSLGNCTTSSQSQTVRITFIDKNGNYLKKENGSEMRVLELSAGLYYGNDLNNTEGFYNENTLDKAFEKGYQKEFGENNFADGFKHLATTLSARRLNTQYGIKRIISKSYQKGIAIDNNDKLDYNKILQVNVTPDNTLFYMPNIKDNLLSKVMFKGKEYYLYELLYIFGNIDTNSCQYTNTSGCENEFNTWSQKIKTDDYKRFIENAYIMVEPINAYKPLVDFVSYPHETTQDGESYNDKKYNKWYYMTPMEFYIETTTTNDVLTGYRKTPLIDGFYYDTTKTAKKLLNDEGYKLWDETDGWIQQNMYCVSAYVSENPIGMNIGYGETLRCGNDAEKNEKNFAEKGTNGMMDVDSYGKKGLNVYGMGVFKIAKTEEEMTPTPTPTPNPITPTPTPNPITPTPTPNPTNPNPNPTTPSQEKNPEITQKPDYRKHYWVNKPETSPPPVRLHYPPAITKPPETDCVVEPIPCYGTEKGKFGIKADFNSNCVKNSNFEYINNGGNEAYCYDEKIEYDFSKLYKTLDNENQNTISPNKKLVLPNGYITIQKKCYTKVENDSFIETIEQSISPEFNNNEADIKLELFEKEYTYQIDKTQKKSFYQKGINEYNEEIVEFTYKYPMNLKQEKWMQNQNTIIVSNNQAIGLYDAIFQPKDGILNHIINMSELNKKIYNGMFDDGVSKVYESNGKKYYTNNSYYFKKVLNIQYSIEGEERGLTCNTTTEVTPRIYLEDTKFRVISLSYPFPGKDGQSRLPGLNWLNRKNNVYNYITNNRNIQEKTSGNDVINPEMIYLEKDPIYVIKLDAQNMIRTREYNKTHTYTDLDLRCLDGEKCLSKFIRDNFLLDGTCLIGGYPEHILKYAAYVGTNATDVYGTPIKNFDTYYKSEVLDMYIQLPDGKVNSKDANAYLLKGSNKTAASDKEAQKYTDFYACADKTKASSGKN